jgi:hypothetical protein
VFLHGTNKADVYNKIFQHNKWYERLYIEHPTISEVCLQTNKFEPMFYVSTAAMCLFASVSASLS